MKSIARAWSNLSLIQRICLGLLVGIILGFTVPQATAIGILGTLFVTALKSVAPILVLFLIMSAISYHKQGQKTNIRDIFVMYIVGTLLAATTAAVMAFIFPVKLILGEAAEDITPPEDLATVVQNILANMVANPVDALLNANFLGILVWAVLLGIALRHASDGTKKVISDLSDAITVIVRWVILFAPLGVLGLVFTAISENGAEVLGKYVQIIILLVATMAIDALVINPIIVFTQIRQNPYPLVLRCLKDSGITAFFTRSSAANVPVNMELCESLGLDKNTYSISIPLGATVNMEGAAITISILTLCAANTLGIQVSLPVAIILCVLSAASACGASGVPGGSLLLIPLCCSLFGIPADIAAQVIGVGFIVAVIQDSCETGLNSSTDALFTAAADFKKQKKEGKEIHVDIFAKNKKEA